MKLQKLKILPGILVLLCVCFGMRFTIFNNHLSRYAWYGTNSQTSDFFYVFRSKIILVTMGIILFLIIVEGLHSKKRDLFLTFYDKKEKLCFIFLISFAGFVLLSGVCSQYPYFTWHGIADHYESTLIWLAYLLITIYGGWKLSLGNIRLLLQLFFYSMVFMVFLGLSQLSGHDFFASKLGLFCIVPNYWRKLLGDVSYEFAGSGWNQVYLSFYNPNLVGMFSALTLPLLFMMALAQKEWKRYIILGIALLLFIVTLGSGSKTYMFSFLGAIILFILLYYVKGRFSDKQKKISVIVLVCLLFTIFLYRNNGISFGEYFLSAFHSSEQVVDLQKITAEKVITVQYCGQTYHISHSVASEGSYFFLVTDENEQPCPLIQLDKERMGIEVKKDKMFYLSMSDLHFNEPCLTITIDNIPWHFSWNLETDKYDYITYSGKPDTLESAEHWLFEGQEQFASKRGYIWSRTLPLLKTNLFLGTGADTFTLVYPNNDYLAKASYGYHGVTITKPHNLYLQIAVQTGVLSLIAFIGIYMVYFIDSICLYKSISIYEQEEFWGLGILLGTFGYLISGLAIDSSVCVSPLYWLFLGVGVTINRCIKQKKGMGI
ncbi:MAG: O-antigen ligase family protein [Lachnospiraceae bacterium]|jgi:hypothetical protein|nr:O-antigen ligase family protein [Lachnospiraceae bacterium]